MRRSPTARTIQAGYLIGCNDSALPRVSRSSLITDLLGTRLHHKLIIIAACFACGSAPSTIVVEPGDPARLVALAGEGQAGLTHTPLTDSLVVRVVDADGTPVEGAVVRWEGRGDGGAHPNQSTTGRDGIVSTLYTAGEGAGLDTIRGRVDALEIAFVAEIRLADPGETYEGRAGYVSYQAGELPLIISAGHGGTLEPAEIPDRTEGTLVRDLNTDLLAIAMADSIEARFGARPHLVLTHLHRTKVDVNRDLAEAADGNRLAEQAWREHHGFIDHASARVEAEHGAGFYVDVHGHGHDIDRLELGYLLDSSDLAASDAELDANIVEKSSIRVLVETSDLVFSKLIRGDTSLGTLYESAGVPAVPSAAQPDPGKAPFFSGGYSTRRHGSRDGGTVSGVQIEAHRVGLRDAAANRARFGGISASVLEEYLASHYDFASATAGQ